MITDNNYIYQNNNTNLLKKGAEKMQTATITKKGQARESGAFTKRIGSTNYRVNVHFSKTSRETINDKVLRLIKNDTNGKAAGK